jgi:hypothetical protein
LCEKKAPVEVVVVVVVPKVVHSAELQQGGAVKVLLM